jgi:hypothetical protein
LQTVNYHVDGYKGYVADVKYSGKAHFPHHKPHKGGYGHGGHHGGYH